MTNIKNIITPMVDFTHEITEEQADWLNANYPDIEILDSRKPYTMQYRGYVTQSAKELIDREMIKEQQQKTCNRTLSQVLEDMEDASAVGLREPITDDQFEGFYKNSTIAELEQDKEALQSALILHKSKARVLINYYKERGKLDQAIAKLEEELING